MGRRCQLVAAARRGLLKKSGKQEAAEMMSIGERTKRVLEHVSQERLIALTRDMIAIPSPNFGEAKIADFLADYMTGMGLTVRMMEVPHPNDTSKKTKQPIGLLRGTGGGPCLMLNGHMDTNVVMSDWTVDPYVGKFEDGWIWGLGAQDDKGGLAAVITAVDSVVRSGLKLKGDVLV